MNLLENLASTGVGLAGAGQKSNEAELWKWIEQQRKQSGVVPVTVKK